MKLNAEVKGAAASGCRGCGNVFASLALFDRHREGPWGNRSCRAPEALGLVQGQSGTWRTPEGLESSLQRASQLRAARWGN